MREQIISTQRLIVYQTVNLITWLVLLLGICAPIIYNLSSGRGDLLHLFWLVYWGFGFYSLFIKRVLRLKSIGYDEEQLYIKEKDQEIIIPFTEINTIRLRTALGTHSINLYRDLGFGKIFYFKSSLWYPFNFKKVDDEVYELQKKIAYAKAHYKEQNVNALGS